MTRRILVVAMLLVVTFGYLAPQVDGGTDADTRSHCPVFRCSLAPGRDNRHADLEQKILDVLGVDDYARRTY